MMRTGVVYTAFAVLLVAGMNAAAIEQPQALAFGGQDLHLRGSELISYQPGGDKNILVFKGNFSMSIGANTFSSNSAVVWLSTIKSEYQGRGKTEYYAQVFLEGDVSVKKGKTAQTTDIAETMLENGRALVARFHVSGDVFATANKRTVSDPNNLDIYKRAAGALAPVKYEPFVNPEAVIAPEKQPPAPAQTKAAPAPVPAAATPSRTPSLLEEFFAPAVPGAEVSAEEKKPAFRYPINISPATDVKPKIESAVITPEGISAATVIGRFYVWQKLDEHGGLLELQADNAVIFYSSEQFSLEGKQAQKDNVLASGIIKAIYLSGNVVMSESNRTIRANEMFYDFDKHAGLAINAEMRTFDESRNIPIYVRASKLRQLSQTKFDGENIVLTTSEFYVPQLSLQASSIVISDTTAIAGQLEKMGDSAYTAYLSDVRFKLDQTTLLRFPRMQTDMSGVDVPIRSLHLSYDNTFGLGVETQWYLARLLGLRQPEGTDSTLLLDYFGDRGPGGGVNVDYEREKYFGKIESYIIDDHGEDDLGRINGRKNVPPPEDLRGLFAFQHRQFLPYKWQLTVELSYLSDHNFLEEYYRGIFNTGKEQETLIHLKRIQDNWGLSLLAKWRINNFQDTLEELPSVEYHRTAESVFDNKFTFYSDTQLANLRQRIGDDEPINISQKNYAFASSRNELDLPLALGTWKFVPYVAGTVGYDDRSGFQSSLVDQEQPTGSPGSYTAGIGEIGTRFSTQYWTVYPDAQSRLFDVNQIRHLAKPYFVVSGFTATDDVLEDEERNSLNIGMLQRWQTKRGPAGKQETVDWMRLDGSVTIVDNEANEPVGPNQYIWNKPLVPLRVLSAPGIFNGDLSTINPTLARFEQWGPQRNTFDADYVWRVTDTLAVLSDIDYDFKSGVVTQMDIGYVHLAYPRLSYYLGSRYLRNVDVLNQKGSDVFTAAVTYIIDPRYTITFAQQYDFDYEANLRSEVTIIRQYHRIYYGLSFSADESLDRQTIMFSIWPQGVPELAVGSRRYVGVTGQSMNE